MLAACSTEYEQPLEEVKSVSKNSFKVSEEEAIERLEKMLNVFDPATRGKTRTIKDVIAYRSRYNKTRAYAAEIPDTLMYIINFDDENGYAVVSADERANDFVLALIDTGNYNPTQVSCSSIDTLSYEELYNLLGDDEKDDFFCSQVHATIPSIEMIEDYLMSEMSNNEYIVKEIDTILIEQVGPFLNTRWGQGEPYNWMCHFCTNGHFHLDNTITNCKTGCVATALAQVLAYYKFPASLYEHTYEWDIMHQVKTVYANTSSKTTYEVAHLMKSAGLACSMDYGVENSSSTAQRAKKALKNIFGYNNVEKFNSFAGNTIVNELKSGILPIVSGLKRKKFKGHTWIIDGYRKYKFITKETKYTDNTYTEIETTNIINEEEKYYFHCNYGWSGVADGYYLGKIFNAHQGPEFVEDDEEPYRSSSDDSKNYTWWFRTVIYDKPND